MLLFSFCCWVLQLTSFSFLYFLGNSDLERSKWSLHQFPAYSLQGSGSLYFYTRRFSYQVNWDTIERLLRANFFWCSATSIFGLVWYSSALFLCSLFICLHKAGSCSVSAGNYLCTGIRSPSQKEAWDHSHHSRIVTSVVRFAHKRVGTLSTHA